MEPSELDPERGVKVTAMLADYAAAADGKLTAVGAGWNVIGPQPIPFAFAILVEVPWHLTNKQHTVRLELIDLDGNPVTPTGADGPPWLRCSSRSGGPRVCDPGPCSRSRYRSTMARCRCRREATSSGV